MKNLFAVFCLLLFSPVLFSQNKLTVTFNCAQPDNTIKKADQSTCGELILTGPGSANYKILAFELVGSSGGKPKILTGKDPKDASVKEFLGSCDIYKKIYIDVLLSYGTNKTNALENVIKVVK
jgi:hypothetical protein